MRMIFIRHGAKRSGEGDPQLTSAGRKMSYELGKWLLSRGYLPKKAYRSSTKRTEETLEEVMFACNTKLDVISTEIPEFWDDWLNFLEGVSQSTNSDFIIAGHHPTVEMLIDKYNISIPPRNFASAIVLKKCSNRLWNYIDSWQGRADLN